MSKKAVVELNRAGVAELMKSEEMQKHLQSLASDIISRAGDGYEQDTLVGENRANVAVVAETAAARLDCFRNNTLLKAVRG